MNQTIFLMLGLLGLVGIGSVVSSNDDDHAPEGDPIDPRLDGGNLIEGDDEPNEITGTDGGDSILAKGGDDTVHGGAGDDGIRTGDGADFVDGGAGDDLIYTGRGNDTVSADPGDDEIYLGAGDDLYGAYDLGADDGNDTIDGGSGNDTIITNLGHHSISGGTGDDQIEDHGGIVHIDGGDGDDLILSPDDSEPDAADTLLGGSGNDTIHAGANDIVDGGEGADHIYLSSRSAGAADITLDGDDSLTINIAMDYTGSERCELVQDGEDVRVLLDDQPIALLRGIQVEDVPTITLRRPTL